MKQLPSNMDAGVMGQIQKQLKGSEHYSQQGGKHYVSEQVYSQLEKQGAIPKQQTSAPTQQQTSAPKSTQSNEEDSTFPFNTPGFLLMALIFFVMVGAKKGCFKDVSISDVFTKEARDDRPGRQPENVYVLPVDGIKGGVDVVETYDRKTGGVTVSVNGTQIGAFPAQCDPTIPSIKYQEADGKILRLSFGIATDECVTGNVKIRIKDKKVLRKEGEINLMR